ncbi:MAG: TetR family transcriptional regulator [Acidimicrobiales bacterium]|nr:TetR family transcriptional regulator [Acidimicrobiales bacterium]
MPKLDEEANTDASVAPKRGRRLSEDRSDVILSTVLELINEVGYDQLRVQDVADRANVGLSTIYRRWPTKQDVVRAALQCEEAAQKWVTTGDARADVKSTLVKLAENLAGDGGQTVLGLLATMRTDPEVRDLFRETMLDHLHLHLRTLLASELGEDHPDLDLRASAGPAILIYTAAICGKPMDAEAMAERLADLLFAPTPGLG